MHNQDDPADAASTDRRAFLLALGAAGVTGLAGCGGDDGEDTPTSTTTDTEADDGNGMEPTATATETGTVTQTATGTETGTETSTGAEEELGDPPAEILSLSETGLVSPGSTVTLEGTVSHPYLFDLQNVELSMSAPEGWSVSPSEPQTFDSIDSGGSRDVSWELTVPEDTDGEYTLTVDVHFESATDSADRTIERTINVFTGEVPVDGLQAYYPLDADTPTDAAGDNDATINGDPATDATGVVNGAYDFDGEDDFLTYPDVGVTYDGSADWTTSLWFNADSLPSDDDYWLWHPRAKSDIFIWVEVDSDEIRFSTYPGDYDDLQSGVTLPTGEWVHVCVVSDTSADSQYRLFVDGMLEAESDLSDPNDVNASNLIGGQNAPDLDMRYFDGRIDEVRLYDRALAQEEVQALTSQGG